MACHPTYAGKNGPNSFFCQTAAWMLERAHGNAMSFEIAGSSLEAATLTNSAGWARPRQINPAVMGFKKEFLTPNQSGLARQA